MIPNLLSRLPTLGCARRAPEPGSTHPECDQYPCLTALGFSPGQLVEIVGVGQRPELNGQVSELVREEKGRWVVRLTGSGEQVSLAPSKLQPKAASNLQPKADDPWWQWLLDSAPSLSSRTDDLTVLFLGPTGSGKSSFMNLLFNFETVIQHRWDAIAGNMKNFLDIGFENEVKDQMVSKTSAATVYEMRLGPMMLKIIDTPGFGDTRGQDFDKKSAKRIVDCVKGQGYVHAIVIVLSGRDSRMTAQLKYVLSEVCAILPSGARHNIISVFTNTSNSGYMNFNIADLNKLVERTVEPDRQIFIENPYVLWERGQHNKDNVDPEDFQKGLSRAFEDAGENLRKFFASLSKMPKLNTNEFEGLYNLRRNIEATTVELLSHLANAQEEQRQLEVRQREIEGAKSVERMNSEYTKPFKSKRWVFKDAQRHGTFCAFKDCHSNCHAPCIMEKTEDNSKFKFCSAFRYKEREVQLRDERMRDQLLGNFEDESIRFFEQEDGGKVEYHTVLRGKRGFKFEGISFLKGAFLRGHGGCCQPCGMSAADDMRRLPLPAQVTIRDTSDQDTCNVCGHHRKFHFHDEKIWVREPYSEQMVDESAKNRYFEAKDLVAKKQEAFQEIKRKVNACEAKQQELGQQLVANIRQFENKGLSRNYALLLQNQRDLLEQHMEAQVDGEGGTDMAAVKKALAGVEKQLEVVQKRLSQKPDKNNEVAWARAMLNVSKSATLSEINETYRDQSRRFHPDKNGGNPERMKQLNDAVGILRRHAEGSERVFERVTYLK